MRTTLFLLAGLLCLSGCSQEPELTPEQKKGLEVIGQLASASETDAKSAECWERIDATLKPLLEQGKKIAKQAEQKAEGSETELSFDMGEIDLGFLELTITHSIRKEYERRQQADGQEKAVEWLDAESRKTLDELVKAWGDEDGSKLYFGLKLTPTKAKGKGT